MAAANGEISQAVADFEEAFKSQQRRTQLNTFIDQYPHDRLRRVLQLIKQANISWILHAEYIAGVRVQAAQPDSDSQRDLATPIYTLVQQRLNEWTSERQVPRLTPATYPGDDETSRLLAWSAEIWFIKHLSSYFDVGEWLRDHGAKELFAKYFSMQRGTDRLADIAEKNACDFIEGLLQVGNVEEKLKNFLKRPENVLKITKDELSKKLTQIYLKRSADYYIIPRPTESFKMYGMHFYLANHFKKDKDENKILTDSKIGRVREESKVMRRALRDCHFYLRGPDLEDFHPDTGTFDQLEEWLRRELNGIKNTCSLLFMSFSLHGVQGCVIDANEDLEKSLRRIQQLLAWIHEVKELREIPTVVVIQACQNVPEEVPHDSYPQSNEEYQRISKELNEYVKNTSKNTILLMAESEGEPYIWKWFQDTPSYLMSFANDMSGPGDRNTMYDHHMTAQRTRPHNTESVDRIKKAIATRQKSAEAKMVLRPAGGAADVPENVPEERDDGQNLIQSQDWTEEESENLVV